MSAPAVAETLQQLRDAKRDQLADAPLDRERGVIERQTQVLDEVLADVDAGRSLEGAVARQHETSHEALYEAMELVEAVERLTVEIRQEVDHGV